MNNDQLFEDMIQLDQEQEDIRKLKRLAAVGFMRIEAIQDLLNYEKELVVREVDKYFKQVQEILTKK